MHPRTGPQRRSPKQQRSGVEGIPCYCSGLSVKKTWRSQRVGSGCWAGFASKLQTSFCIWIRFRVLTILTSKLVQRWDTPKPYLKEPPMYSPQHLQSRSSSAAPSSQFWSVQAGKPPLPLESQTLGQTLNPKPKRLTVAIRWNSCPVLSAFSPIT